MGGGIPIRRSSVEIISSFCYFAITDVLNVYFVVTALICLLHGEKFAGQHSFGENLR